MGDLRRQRHMEQTWDSTHSLESSPVGPRQHLLHPSQPTDAWARPINAYCGTPLRICGYLSHSKCYPNKPCVLREDTWNLPYLQKSFNNLMQTILSQPSLLKYGVWNLSPSVPRAVLDLWNIHTESLLISWQDHVLWWMQVPLSQKTSPISAT